MFLAANAVDACFQCPPGMAGYGLDASTISCAAITCPPVATAGSGYRRFRGFRGSSNALIAASATMNARSVPMGGLSRGMDPTAISSAAFATRIGITMPVGSRCGTRYGRSSRKFQGRDSQPRKETRAINHVAPVPQPCGMSAHPSNSLSL